MKKCCWLFASLCFALWITTAAAQSTSRVTGTIQDKSGAVVPGADVTLTNQATQVSVHATTTSSGAYVFDGIVPGTYTITISKAGFTTLTTTGNVLTIAQPLVFNGSLQVGAAAEKVEVTAGAQLVQTETSGDLGALIDQRALETLPIVGARGRSPLSLLELVPGVVDGGPMNSTGANITGGGVTVNGSRDRSWNYTLDGIDINETSAPGSNFSPLRTNPDSISGYRVITTNANAEFGATSGAQVILETRSGSNQFHGNVFWFYQTPGLNANDPGNKENGLDRPQFVQNILGFSVGGPIIRNKTFFFVNTQFLHASQDFPVTSIVYTQPARNGQFRYVLNNNCRGNNCPRNTAAGQSGASVDANGNPIVPIGTYDVGAMDPQHIGLDPAIQKYLGLTPMPNNFTVGDGLNTAGYTALAPEEERQVDFTVRIDHQFNARNSIYGRWAHGHQNTVGDAGNGGLRPFPNAPNVVNTLRQPRNLSVSWRYTPSASITNELIAGMNRFVFNFINPDSNYLNNPPYVLNGDQSGNGALTSPLQNYVGNLRAPTDIELVDNLTYLHGAHALKFGTDLRYQRHIDDRGSIGAYDAQPLVYFEPSVNHVDPKSQLPDNINGTYDLPTLLGSINNLLGRVGSIQQGFVAASASQYAPAGTHLLDDFRMPEYDFYAQDSWKARPNLVIDLGLRWEIKLSPRTSDNFLLRPNQPFTVGSGPTDTMAWTPGHLYKDAWHLLSPSVGFAWDPFADGKTSVRGNYRLAYDRMNTFVLSSAVFQGMPGATYQYDYLKFGLAGGRLSQGLPTLAPPADVTPQSFRQPDAFSTTSITAVNPNWTPPQVSEWSFSIQHQVGNNTVAEVSYIGHHAVHLFGAYDANQANIQSNGFLQAFNTVKAGGDSPLIDQLLANDPGRVDAHESGSKYLADPNDDSYYRAFSLGSVAEVAKEIGLATDSTGKPLTAETPFFFFNYPQFSAGYDVLDSNDWSLYNALQATYHGRVQDLTFQVNYTWSKSLDSRSFDPTFSTVVAGSSSFGSSSTPFNNYDRRLNYGPADTDRTHVLQGIWTYQVPFGSDRRWGANLNPLLSRVVGGWELSGDVVAESGRPITIFSPAYTLSSIVRTPASCDHCSRGMMKVHRDPVLGLNYFTPAQIAKFSTPAPGQFSNVGRNYFRLAPYSVLNLSAGKITHIAWDHALELRIEMQNALNSQHYDQPASGVINSTVFGAADPAVVENAGYSTGASPRTVQLSAKYRF
jgi:hypothetical protein